MNRLLCMQVKSGIKIACISILFISLIYGGITMFRGLINNKQVFESDLYAFLPSEASGILQINKEKDLNKTLTFWDDLSSIINNIKSSITYPVLMVQENNCNYIITKVTDKQESDIKETFNRSVFPLYPPNEKMYKSAKLLLYPTSDNRFFICTFYNGIFIGGYNVELFEKYIDNKENNNRGFISSPLGKDIFSRIKSHYHANLFLNNATSFSVFNINFENEKILMDGYDTYIANESWECNNQTDTLRIDYTIFPDTPIAFSIDMENPIVSDTLKCEFASPSYTFYLKEKGNPVFLLKHIKDKFHIYNILNDKEEKYTGKKFNINDFFNGQRIYTTSGEMAKDIFNTKKIVYLTFYKDYMIFSEDRSSLEYYLIHNGKFHPTSSFDMDQEKLSVSSAIYSKDLNLWHPDFLNPENPITEHYNKDIYIVSSTKDKKRNYKISINK